MLFICTQINAYLKPSQVEHILHLNRLRLFCRENPSYEEWRDAEHLMDKKCV